MRALPAHGHVVAMPDDGVSDAPALAAPAAQLFGTTGMAWADWGVVLGVACTVVRLEEARKPRLRTLRSRLRWHRPSAPWRAA